MIVPLEGKTGEYAATYLHLIEFEWTCFVLLIV